MDDLTEQTRQWFEQARRLSEAHDNIGPKSLSDRLDSIAAGLRLRRQLDLSGPGDPAHSIRRELLQALAKLQLQADALMTSLAPGAERDDLIVGRTREWLDEVRATLRNIATGPSVDVLRQALAIEGLRTELEWHSSLIDRLDHETPHPASAWLDVELARLGSGLGSAAVRGAGAGNVALEERCARMQAVMLDRRIKRELAHTADGKAPEAFWADRFYLTRLQAQAKTLELATGEARHHADLPFDRKQRIEELDQRRTELAKAAESRLASLPPCPLAPPTASELSSRPSTRRARPRPSSRT